MLDAGINMIVPWINTYQRHARGDLGWEEGDMRNMGKYGKHGGRNRSGTFSKLHFPIAL